MNGVEWRPFLERWSKEWIAGHDPERDAPLAPEAIRDRWLGFAPATAAQVAAAEARLGRELPPSLRNFLLVTNGWRDAGNFIYRLAGTAELAWLADTDDAHWIEVYEELAEEEGGDDEDPYDEHDEDEQDDEDDEDGDDPYEGEDGEEADDEDPFPVHEAKVLARSLRVSLEGDAAVMLLDPDDVDADGEWAAYWLASWSGEGPERYGSFYELMHHQYVSFHALNKPPGETRDQLDAEVEAARLDALAGAVDAPMAVFRKAHDWGGDLADVLMMQMEAMLGDWLSGITDLAWHRADDEELLLSPLFAAELLPLLVRQDRLAERFDLRPLPRLKEAAPQPVRAVIADYEARLARPGFRHTFGNPEFDAAVHAVADRLAAAPAFRAPADPPPVTGPFVVTLYAADAPARDPLADPYAVREARAELCAAAWPDLLAAVPLWRPLTQDHIAPIALLADPVLAELITPSRGRHILATARG